MRAQLLTSAVATVGLVVVGVLISSVPDKAPNQDDGTGLPTEVARAAFCDRVSVADLEKALGSAITGEASYAPGDDTTVATGVRDIVDEYSCSWAVSDGLSVRVWLFAPPVTADQATELAAQTPKGCHPLPTATPFGTPTSGYSCPDDGTAVLRGLFGNAWLTCEVSSAVVSSESDGLSTMTLSETPPLDSTCAAVARAAAAS